MVAEKDRARAPDAPYRLSGAIQVQHRVDREIHDRVIRNDADSEQLQHALVDDGLAPIGVVSGQQHRLPGRIDPQIDRAVDHPGEGNRSGLVDRQVDNPAADRGQTPGTFEKSDLLVLRGSPAVGAAVPDLDRAAS